MSAFAEPVIGGATNAASFVRPGLPNSGLAQGGMATLFGTGLGPDSFESASVFPLPTELAGVAVKIHTGGASLDAIPVRVSAGQTTVVVPSETPVGPAGITLTYNGETSSPFLVEIVAHALGIFALNQAGS
ncbi:MAG: hypothetical protein GY953_54935, partial [bacterium]|nr:hypothetical protein [bacterium]